MKKTTLALLAAAGMASAASAAVLNVDLAGWQAEGGYLNPGNTSLIVSLPIGTTIDSISFVIDFDALGESWRSELVLSVNDSTTGDFWDFNPGVGINSPGNFVGAGNFPDPALFGSGPFTLTTGDLFITVYESFNDAGIDSVINSGTLTINYTVPTPATAGMLALGGLFAARRRRIG
ncbi:MAG: VPLPA-CTERM sorting domain-containing protein [Phycisphaeraceae bacterium]|nr:VPLPA-CTERM sorting domain-containing protein [Phycisphaeraceae bacterium]